MCTHRQHHGFQLKPSAQLEQFSPLPRTSSWAHPNSAITKPLSAYQPSSSSDKESSAAVWIRLHHIKITVLLYIRAMET